MSAARGVHGQAPLAAAVPEESPSLWSRVCKCVSEILSQLWEWITSCCKEKPLSIKPVIDEKPLSLNPIIERVFLTAQNNLSFPPSLPFRAVCLVRVNDRIVKNDWQIVDNVQQYLANASTPEIRASDDWSVKVILAKDFGEPKGRRIVVAKESAEGSIETHAIQTTADIRQLTARLGFEFDAKEAKVAAPIIKFLTYD
jgi:hypothetical protein